jgi:hypothetical protein
MRQGRCMALRVPRTAFRKMQGPLESARGRGEATQTRRVLRSSNGVDRCSSNRLICWLIVE